MRRNKKAQFTHKDLASLTETAVHNARARRAAALDAEQLEQVSGGAASTSLREILISTQTAGMWIDPDRRKLGGTVTE